MVAHSETGPGNGVLGYHSREVPISDIYPNRLLTHLAPLTNKFSTTGTLPSQPARHQYRTTSSQALQ